MPHLKHDDAAALCHLCEARPAAVRDDAAGVPINLGRVERLAGDNDRAVAHIAGAAIAYRHEVEAWKRLAAAETDHSLAEVYRKHAAVATETSKALAQVAQDAKAVSTR